MHHESAWHIFSPAKQFDYFLGVPGCDSTVVFLILIIYCNIIMQKLADFDDGRLPCAGVGAVQGTDSVQFLPQVSETGLLYVIVGFSLTLSPTRVAYLSPCYNNKQHLDKSRHPRKKKALSQQLHAAINALVYGNLDKCFTCNACLI